MLNKSITGIFAALLFTAHGIAAVGDTRPEQEEQQIDTATISEAFGNFLGRTLGSPDTGIDLDIEQVIKGIRKGAAGKPSPVTEQEYQRAMGQLREQAFEKKARENLAAAEEFLQVNETQAGIEVLEKDRLQYKTLKKGDGPVVTESSTPTIEYTGKFLDGAVFGSSDQTGPISIPLQQTIPGFRKGIAGMRQGEKRTLFIHPDFAYGTQGELPPNMLLVFEVQVLDADSSKNKESSLPPSEDEDIIE